LNTLEAIYNRRAVKHFDHEHRLTKEQELHLLNATIQTPTSFNIQHWRFVILRDSALRNKIRKEFGNDQSQITDASLLILFTADKQAWAKSPERYHVNAPKEVTDALVDMIGAMYQGHDNLQQDEAHRSIGMAMQTLMLAAQDMALQSCPMLGFDHEQVAQLVNLPDGYVIGPLVAIGKGIKAPRPKPGQLPLTELVVENSF
jgi:nitroreductase